MRTSRKAQAQAQRVQVTARPELRDITYIPEPIVRLFSARNLRVSLGCGLRKMISELALEQRYPLTRKDFGPTTTEADKLAQDNFIQDELLRHGFIERDGLFWRGDTCLFLQPQEIFEEVGMQAYQRWVDDMAPAEKDAAEIEDEIPASYRKGARVISTEKPADEIAGGFAL